MKVPPDDGADDDGAATGGTGAEQVPGAASDRCSQAPNIAEGLHYASLRGHLPDLGGACGTGGPDAFVRVDIPFRADLFVEGAGVGFAPRLGVLPASCGQDWDDRALACTEGVGAWVLDLAAGTSVLVSVGIDPDDELLQLPPPGEGDDPLDFVLNVSLRNVLGVGDSCEARSHGRCGTGTICATPEPDHPGVSPTAVCTAVDADTCASAQVLSPTLGTTMVPLPAVEHTDAHAHSCTGAHRPERVFAVDLPESDSAHLLRVMTESPDLGLAIRVDGCSLSDEQDCAAAGSTGSEVSASVAASAGTVFVFVEAPADGSPLAGEDGGSDDGGTPGEEPPASITLVVSEMD